MVKNEVEIRRRRILSSLVTAVLIAALFYSYAVFAPTYPRQAYLTGWMLFGVMLFLTFFNLRKKVPFLRLGSTSLWLQIHIYVGILSGAFFLVHIGWSWPIGIFRQIFAVLYLVVFLSGFLGLWISRTFPKKLTVAGFETPFERMPIVRAGLQEEAEALVLEGVDGNTSPVLGKFYTEKLGLFFTKPCNTWAHLRRSQAPLAAHVTRFKEVGKYAKKSELEMLSKLMNLVEQKHLLDYQYALQLTLRLWLFIHIPLSYSVLIFTVLHIVLVHSFSGAAP